MVYIYILKLEHKKYYIGKTINPNRRLQQHYNSEGSTWTKLYKPLKIERVIPDCSNFDEDKYTLEYMSIYGIDNVRGGSFCSVVLTEDIKKIILHMIRSNSDKCFICGNEGHFASNCDIKHIKYKKPYTKTELYSKKPIKIIKSRTSTPTPTNNSQIEQIKLPIPDLIFVKIPFIPELIKIDNPSLIFPIPELIKIKNPYVPELIKIF